MLILGFSGIGKTTATKQLKKQGLKVSDSDSSKFSWLTTSNKVVRNPNFIKDYTQHLQKQLMNNDYVFASTHPEIIKEIQRLKLNHIIITPYYSAKQEYEKRWINRGSSVEFVQSMTTNFDKFVKDILESGSNILILQDKQYLSDVLDLLGN